MKGTMKKKHSFTKYQTGTPICEAEKRKPVLFGDFSSVITNGTKTFELKK